ncbi:hypothetical protein AA12717_0391 [Gluconacetobacter sacchari DSM 12717]|uniref:Uncharacterized protein n=2 Tax=Gluconacetobacter sacchari TaxID=92759 RepID=A0A7W4NLQ5_9PROT|nr:hypothetical protein [Gluconacetobacter sacchari]MBB2160092.1 hypothetical protein [Gluconacetobacter sacchari]GBQ19908.1 hypothetical protein AA12717_0391 [Gluconacetobacter sacchari DSM 12717]
MLTDDRALDSMVCGHAPEFAHPVASASRVYRGSVVAVCQDGTIVRAGTAAPPSPIVAIEGIAQYGQDNTGTSNVYGANSGAGLVPVRKGAWALPFDVAPTWANKGAPVYAVDDETVSLTQTPEGGDARLQVGVLTGIDSTGTPWTYIS